MEENIKKNIIIERKDWLLQQIKCGIAFLIGCSNQLKMLCHILPSNFLQQLIFFFSEIVKKYIYITYLH